MPITVDDPSGFIKPIVGIFFAYKPAYIQFQQLVDFGIDFD
jgi:hypothetical protein